MNWLVEMRAMDAVLNHRTNYDTWLNVMNDYTSRYVQRNGKKIHVFDANEVTEAEELYAKAEELRDSMREDGIPV